MGRNRAKATLLSELSQKSRSERIRGYSDGFQATSAKATGVLNLLRTGHADDVVFGWVFAVLGVIYLGLGLVGLRVRPRAPRHR